MPKNARKIIYKTEVFLYIDKTFEKHVKSMRKSLKSTIF